MFFDTNEQDVIRRAWAGGGNFWDVASEAGDIVERRQQSAEAEFRTLIGANEGESTVDALHRYTFAVQLGCALKLEQRAKEIAEQPPLLPVDKIREVTVAALVGGAAYIRHGVPAAAGQVLIAHVDKGHDIYMCHVENCPDCKRVTAPARYPCSPTCTHDDAATPGHPERVKERSEAFTADDINDTHIASESSGYDKGAEAMRAACWEAAKEKFRLLGYGENDPIWRYIKSAIEGAAP